MLIKYLYSELIDQENKKKSKLVLKNNLPWLLHIRNYFLLLLLVEYSKKIGLNHFD